MGLLGVLLLGVGLSLDTFAVSLSLGFAGCTTHRQRMRFLIVIGIFHFLMIMAGWFLGENVSRLIADYDHWVAFGLLAIILPPKENRSTATTCYRYAIRCCSAWRSASTR